MDGYVGRPANKAVNGPECPQCKSNQFVKPILWGYVGYSEALVARIDDGWLLLGGCIIEDSDWSCDKCGSDVTGVPPDWDRILAGVFPKSSRFGPEA